MRTRDNIRATISCVHELRGFDRNIERVEGILYSDLEESAMHDRLLDLFYELMNSCSYSDNCFAQGFLSDLLERGGYTEYGAFDFSITGGI